MGFNLVAICFKVISRSLSKLTVLFDMPWLGERSAGIREKKNKKKIGNLDKCKLPGGLDVRHSGPKLDLAAPISGKSHEFEAR